MLKYITFVFINNKYTYNGYKTNLEKIVQILYISEIF